MAKKPYCVRLDEGLVEALKAVSRRRSFEENLTVGWVDLLEAGARAIVRAEAEELIPATADEAGGEQCG